MSQQKECDCKQRLEKIICSKPNGIHNNWTMLPTYDVAFMLKFVNEMSEKSLMDMCEGFGNTNYGGIVAQQQLVIAALEHYTQDEIVEVLEIKLEHSKHV